MVLFISEQDEQKNVFSQKRVMNKNIFLLTKIKVKILLNFRVNLNIKETIEVDFVIYLRDFYFAIFWENEVNLVKIIMKDFKVKHL